MIQTDSLEAVKIIQDSSLTISNSTFIRRIHHLLVNARFWVIQYSTDLNNTANCLFKMIFDTNQSLKIFEEIPTKVLTLSPTGQASDNVTQKIFV